LYNQFRFLEAIKKKLYFDNLKDWNRWQNSFLRKLIIQKIKKHQNKVILEDSPADISRGTLTRVSLLTNGFKPLIFLEKK